MDRKRKGWNPNSPNLLKVQIIVKVAMKRRRHPLAAAAAAA